METKQKCQDLLETLNENKNGYLHYNGAQGMILAIEIEQIEATYEEAVKAMALRENVTEEDIENDYDNWYYIVPVSEAIETISHDLRYYHS